MRGLVLKVRVRRLDANGTAATGSRYLHDSRCAGILGTFRQGSTFGRGTGSTFGTSTRSTFSTSTSTFGTFGISTFSTRCTSGTFGT